MKSIAAFETRIRSIHARARRFKHLLVLAFGVCFALFAMGASAAGSSQWSASLTVLDPEFPNGTSTAFTPQSYPTKAQAIAAMRALVPSTALTYVSPQLRLQMTAALTEMGKNAASANSVAYRYAPPVVLPIVTPFLYSWSGGPPTYTSEEAAVAAMTTAGPCNPNIVNSRSDSLSPAGDWTPVDPSANYPPPPYESNDTRQYTVSTIIPAGAGPTCQLFTSTYTLYRFRSVSCPSGYTDAAGDRTSPSRICLDFFTGQVVGPLLECPDNGSPSTSIGDPCDISTGDFYQTESDYASAGLSFSRFYHSAVLESDHTLGVGWTHSYAGYLILSNGVPTGLLRPDGHTDALFKPSPGVYIAYSGSGIHVQQSGTQWIAHLKDGSSEVYSSAGQLQQKVAPNGLVTSLTYNSLNQLITVTGPFGHNLQFNYNSNGQMQQLVDPAGNAIGYAYDANNNLISATYQDLSVRQYLYEDSALPNNLTGIVDENVSRFLTVTYNDATGAVASSQQAGGAQAVSITYSANGAVSTNAIGETDTYAFTNDSGFAQRATSVSRNNLLQSFSVPAGETDSQRRVTQSVDANGNITNFVYDAEHLTSRTEAFGTTQARTTSYQYLATTSALPTLITEALRQTSYVYYPGTNNVNMKTVIDTTVTPNVSRTSTYTYNSNGQVQTIDGPRTDVSDVTTYAYYGCTTGAQCGQISSVTSAATTNAPSGLTTNFNTYNAHAQPLTMSDPNGVVTTLTYDLRQRMTSRQVGTELTTVSYFPTGLVQKATLPDGSYIQYSYDNAHRLTQISDGAGNRVTYALDALGNRIGESTFDPTNTLSRTHSRVFNTLSQLSQDIGAAGTAAVTTSLSYDNNGNATAINAPLGRNATNAYDALNRLNQVTDAAGGVTQLFFDANNAPTQVTDPRNLVTSYGNNGFGEVVTLTSPDTAVTRNTYDSGGNLQTTTDARGAVATFTHDALNRVTSVAYQFGGTTDQTVTYTFDSGIYGKGRLTGAGDANHSLAWSYDALGRITGKGQTVAGITRSVGYGYTNGDLTTLTTPSGQTVTYLYSNNHIMGINVNSTSLLTSAAHEPFGPIRGWTWGNGTTEVRLHNTDGNQSMLTGIESVSLGYDNAFRIIGANNSANSSFSWNYAYDSLDRLTSASKIGTTLAWTYDANGNRQQQTGAVAGNALPTGTPSFTFNGRGRMSSATIGSTTSNYTYNALGQLIEKNVGGTVTLLVYDESGHLLGEYSSTGALIEETVWLGDLPVATLRPNGASVSVYYVHADQLNAPRMITRSSDNAVVWRWDSDPFGTTLPNQNPQSLGTFVYNLRFPGQYYNAETGLDYNWHRDYDPSSGRYIESDPIGLAGGSYSTFAYAGNNPVSNYDRSGFDCTGNGLTMTCTPVPGGPSWTIPQEAGFPNSIAPGEFYHWYDKAVPYTCKDPANIVNGIINNPTPGTPSPASTQGTPNDATPSVAATLLTALFLGSGASEYTSTEPPYNPVKSYVTTDTDGNTVIVNVTLPGHNLFPGYVARVVSNGVVHNYGEGLGVLQSDQEWSVIRNAINNVWLGQTQGILNQVKSTCGCN